MIATPNTGEGTENGPGNAAAVAVLKETTHITKTNASDMALTYSFDRLFVLPLPLTLMTNNRCRFEQYIIYDLWEKMQDLFGIVLDIKSCVSHASYPLSLQ